MAQAQRRLYGISLRLPESTRDKAIELAKGDGISLNHFVSLAIAERLVRMDRPRPVLRQPLPRPAMATALRAR